MRWKSRYYRNTQNWFLYKNVFDMTLILAYKCINNDITFKNKLKMIFAWKIIWNKLESIISYLELIHTWYTEQVYLHSVYLDM